MSKVKQAFTFDFETELQRVLRRTERLKAALAGSADVTTYKVRAHKVRAHERAEHTRYLITLRKV